MAFRVGQKVCCVRDTDPFGRDTWVNLGGIYEVSDVFLWGNIECVRLCGAPADLNKIGWRGSMFRPLIERKTDISIFTAMLTPSKQGADA